MAEVTKFTVNDGQVSVYEFETFLAPGSFGTARKKFALDSQRLVLTTILDEVDPDAPGPKLYLGDVKKREIQIIGIQRILLNRFWAEVEYIVLFPPNSGGGDPGRGTYRSVRWNAGIENGVAVLGQTIDRKLIFVNEFKHALRRWCRHFVRGLRKPDESLEECGIRELLEEGGIRRTPTSQVIDLGPIYPDSGALTSIPRLLMVTDLEIEPTAARHDVTEAIAGTCVMTVPECMTMIAAGELPDAFTRSALLAAIAKGLISLA